MLQTQFSRSLPKTGYSNSLTRILEGKQVRVSGSHAGNQQDKYDSFLHTHEESFQALLDLNSGEGWHAVLSRARFVQQSVEAPVLQVWLTILMCSSLLTKVLMYMSIVT